VGCDWMGCGVWWSVFFLVLVLGDLRVVGGVEILGLVSLIAEKFSEIFFSLGNWWGVDTTFEGVEIDIGAGGGVCVCVCREIPRINPVFWLQILAYKKVKPIIHIRTSVLCPPHHPTPTVCT